MRKYICVNPECGIDKELAKDYKDQFFRFREFRDKLDMHGEVVEDSQELTEDVIGIKCAVCLQEAVEFQEEDYKDLIEGIDEFANTYVETIAFDYYDSLWRVEYKFTGPEEYKIKTADFIDLIILTYYHLKFRIEKIRAETKGGIMYPEDELSERIGISGEKLPGKKKDKVALVLGEYMERHFNNKEEDNG